MRPPMHDHIPASTRRVLEHSTFHVGATPYYYLKAGRIGDPTRHRMVCRDPDETTVVTDEAGLDDVEVLERNRDRWRWIEIDCANPFYCVGFLATITDALCRAGIDVLVISSYSRDHALVPEADVAGAAAVLGRLGLKPRR